MKIIFLLPGREFTKGFLKSWTKTFSELRARGIAASLMCDYSADIYNLRNSLLAPPDFAPYSMPVTPFAGKLDYTHLFWIDSDMVFTAEHVLQLAGDEVDIVSGICPIDQTRAAVAVEREEDGHRVLSYLNAFRIDEVQVNERGLIPIDFAGFAFLCIRKGVFEAMEYPWFRFRLKEWGGNIMQTSEDFGWCQAAREAGFTLFADPRVKIGHEKAWVLQP